METNEFISKIKFFENLIKQFAIDNIDEAYDKFNKEYGYDLRKQNNDDKLLYSKWTIDQFENILYILYKESTPHDIKYDVVIEYDLSEFILNIKNSNE